MTKAGSVTNRLAAAALFAALGVAVPVSGQAQMLSSPAPMGIAAQLALKNGSSHTVQVADDAGGAAPAASGGLPDAVVPGVGCLVAAGGAMGAAYLSSPTEVIMLIAGGLLVPSSSSILALSLTATLVGASCSIGALAAPAVAYAIDQKDAILGQVAWQTTQASSQLAGLVGLGGGVTPARQVAESSSGQ